MCYAAGIDFNSTTSSLLFTPTNSGDPQCTDISIVDDTILENDEVFSVELSTNDLDVDFETASAMVTISDNDGRVLYTLLIFFSL